jgi:hypothetical protein
MQIVQKGLIPPLSDIQKTRELVGKTKFAALVQNQGLEEEALKEGIDITKRDEKVE